MKPIELRIQNYYIQTGVEEYPQVMWKYASVPLEAERKRQAAYEVLLYQEGKCLYSTGKVASPEQNGIELPCGLNGCGVELNQQAEYQFQVRVWDEGGQEYLSDKAKFITGVKNWQGKWIGNGTAKPFVAKKEFVVEGVQRTGNAHAILSLCVPGQFEVRLNGEKICPYVYEGSQTDFNKHVHYSTYDVMELLQEGTNELTVEVANGWYIGDDDGGKRYFYTIDKGYEPFGSVLSMLAQMVITDTAGNREFIVSDESWQVSPSKTVLADIYGSEDMDYTREYDWQQASVVEGPKGQIIPYDYPPVVEKQCYEPVKMWNLDETIIVYDFGQNMSSQFEICIKGERGQIVKLTPAEKLKGEDVDPSAPIYSLLTLSGGEDTFRQKFSLNGARWYKVEGVTSSQILAFKSYFVTSSAKKSGYFHCSDERLNGIFRIIENAVDSNLNHSHTDCPTFEKLGWLEPNHLMGKAVMYLKDVDMMWSKIAQDMRDAQYGEDEFDMDTGAFPHEYKAGLVPSIAPRYARFIIDWKEGSFWDIIPWGSSIILAAYEQYLFYGNTKVLADNYEAAKRYIEYLTNQYNDYNRLYGKSGEEKFICAGLGDWGVAQNKGRSRENVETAFYYRDLKVMAEIARVLSESVAQSMREGNVISEMEASNKGTVDLLVADARSFEAQAREVCDLYNKALLVWEDEKSDRSGHGAETDGAKCKRRAYYRTYDSGEECELTQTNQALPLYFGMVPEEARPGVEATLVTLCEGNPLVCGEVGLVYILRSLAALGRNDIIFDMITREQHPSYLRFVRQGETTLPEFWRDDARSRNHDMMGHIMEWFFAEVAGIKGSVGFETVSIKPACKDFVEGFECEYDSVRGKIKVVYDGEKLAVEVPSNVVAVIE